MCDFCAQVRKNKNLYNKCISHDNMAFEVCDKTHSIYKYHCHMGLVEVAKPIIKNEVILGYLLFGQISDTKQKQEVLEKINFLDDSIDKVTLTKNLEKIKYRSKHYIDSVSHILEMSAAYILENDYLSVQMSTIADLISVYINSNLSLNLKNNTLCERFNISRTSLYTLWKEVYGISVSEYIKKQRINKAKKLLKQTEMSVSSIAEAIGIPDANYFIKVFKTSTGMTPKKYQKS